MRSFSLSLSSSAIMLACAMACQSPAKPGKPADSAVAARPEANEYLHLVAEVAAAFKAARSNPVFDSLIGEGNDRQVKLLTREAPVLPGDINTDGAPDAIAAFSVLTPETENLQYAVFLRRNGELKMVQALPRKGGETRVTYLSFTSIDEKGLVWGMQTEKGMDPGWTVAYTWNGIELMESVKSPAPSDPAPTAE